MEYLESVRVCDHYAVDLPKKTFDIVQFELSFPAQFDNLRSADNFNFSQMSQLQTSA